MQPQQIESTPLSNGLTLEISDASREVAADRWLVKIVARIEIEVSLQWFGNGIQPPANIDQMRARLGPIRRYEYQIERNFVGHNEKQTVFDNMLHSLTAKKPYYSHPDFAARFLVKAYAEHRFYSDQP